MSHIQKQIDIYHHYQPIYAQYQMARDKEKFLRGHESKLILFEAAVRELKRMNVSPSQPSSTYTMKKKVLEKALSNERSNYQKTHRKAKELQIIMRNVNLILDTTITNKPIVPQI